MAELVNANPINETHANVKRSRSVFPLKQMILDTHRFGEIHPHLVIDGVTSDKLPFHSSHSAKSYTLKAPLMQDIQMHKDYFMIPLRAILPLQADRIITNPTLGDDVPSDAYTNVENFVGQIETISDIFISQMSTLNEEDTPPLAAINTLFMKWLVLMESVFSDGSLLASLGCNLSSCLRFYGNFTGNPERTIDYIFDAVCGYLSSLNSLHVAGLKPNGAVVVTSYTGEPKTGEILFRDFLQQIRDDASWQFTQASDFSSLNLYTYFLDSLLTGYTFNFYGTSGNKTDLDLARLWSYHLVNAEFYSNDKVDYIYSADLFRQYIYSLITNGWNSEGYSDPPAFNFSWNGNNLPYDYLSAKYFGVAGAGIVNVFSDSGVCDPYYYQYFLTLFGYHRSLRYKDYFTGSRTRPLAVGDTSIPVVSNSVSVIDVSRNIQMQRFLNAVNATGRKFGEYLKGIFGVSPSPDRHNPIFLAHTTDSIFASEVENTGAAQQTQPNSVTATFRGSSNRYAFEVDVDEPCIILGVTTYDIERAYIRGIERAFYTKDRFDMFLPQLQYVGDQPVYQGELDAPLGKANFGYQFRDMERKQLVNRACGGFAADMLPGYAFVFYAARYGYSGAITISPDYIRSKNVELDQFYVSLTGYSLATYFHFIVLNNNMCNASRPMSVNPQILG